MVSAGGQPPDFCALSSAVIDFAASDHSLKIMAFEYVAFKKKNDKNGAIYILFTIAYFALLFEGNFITH